MSSRNAEMLTFNTISRLIFVLLASIVLSDKECNYCWKLFQEAFAIALSRFLGRFMNDITKFSHDLMVSVLTIKALEGTERLFNEA